MKLTSILYLLIVLALLATPSPALAVGGNVFSVYPEYPTSQINPEAGYYYFAAKPGETVILTASVVNDTNSDILLYAESADAYTSAGGELVFITQNTQKALGYGDEAFMLSQYIDVSADSMTLVPGESVPVPITVEVPDIADSEFIGAVRFFTLSANEDQQNGSGVEVNVKSAQTMPIRIVTGELQAYSMPALTIGEVSLDKFENRYYFAVENNLPMLVTLDALSFHVAGVPDQNISPVKLAPRTNFRVYFEWVGDNAIAGDYTVNIRYQYQSNEKSETRSFTVTEDEAAVMPAPVQSAEPVPSGVFISTGTIIAVAAFVLIIILLLLVFRRRRHQSDDNTT